MREIRPPVYCHYLGNGSKRAVEAVRGRSNRWRRGEDVGRPRSDPTRLSLGPSLRHVGVLRGLIRPAARPCLAFCSARLTSGFQLSLIRPPPPFVKSSSIVSHEPTAALWRVPRLPFPVSDKKTERQHGVQSRLITPTSPPRRSGAGRHLRCGSRETSAAPPGRRLLSTHLRLTLSSGHNEKPPPTEQEVLFRVRTNQNLPKEQHEVLSKIKYQAATRRWSVYLEWTQENKWLP